MNKLFKKVLISSIASFSLFTITSCDFLSDITKDKDVTIIIDDKDKDDDKEKDIEVDEDDFRYSIYQSALSAGYSGTYEEWLNSIKGASIELRVSDSYIQMRYSNQTEWTNLISLEVIKGKSGTDGKSAYEIAVQLGFEGTTEEWLASLKGVEAKEIEFSTNADNILWRYIGDNEWKTVISLDTFKCNCKTPKSAYDVAVELGFEGTAEDWLASLKGSNGKDGKEIELSVNQEYVLWKYVGDTTWNNLISLETLKGADGTNGQNGTDGKSAYEIAIELGFEGTAEDWLVSLKGTNGKDGKEIELSVNQEYVLWKYVDDKEWNNLISLKTLKGANGTNGQNGTDGKSAYEIAVELGFNGTAEDWLASLKGTNGKDGINGINGKEIELSTNDEYIIWRYVGDKEWNNLISLDSLKVSSGTTGEAQKGESAYDLYLKYHPDYLNTEEEWVDDLINNRLNKLSYKTNFIIDGKTVKTKTIFADSCDVKIEEPTKEGYYFVGWFREDASLEYPEFLGKESLSFSYYKTDEINVVAKFVRNEFTLKFKVDDNEVQSSKFYVIPSQGYFYDVPEQPTKEGCKFDGWYINGINAGTSYLYFKKEISYYMMDAESDILVVEARFKELSKELDIYVNYNGQQGITYCGNKTASIYNYIENKEYVMGDLLPTWQAFEKELGVDIKDASSYSTTKDQDTFKYVQINNFKSEIDGSDIDLFYNTTSNINKMGESGQAIDLTPYIENGSMPNFKKFLDNNPEIRYEITTNGKIYYTPYFDSYNDVERGFVMDSSIVELLLNNKNATFDTYLHNGIKGDSNVITDVKYQPFINPDYNYDKDTTVKVSVNGKAYDLTIKKTENIIKQQNELLSKGCTGSDLALQFIDYLNEAFGDNVGEGKIYNNLSEIFTSEAAAYNVDELIALMRVAKANPGLITGDIYNEVETLFPRGQAANRVQNILQFAQVWGVQGLTSEKDFLYFLQDGTLNDARTTQASYDALDNLAALYSEGLILNDFWYYSDAAKDGSAYYKKYFAKTTDDYGYGLLEYDYFTSQCAGNDMVNGIGTSHYNRKAYTGSVNGIKPILPPLTMWPTDTKVSVNQSLFDFTGKTLMRHYDENRTIKANAWCIPANSDNVENAIRLMDYLYSTMGSYIQDFGPSEYWENADKVLKDPENVVPVLSRLTYEMLEKSNLDFFGFMRTYLGATHGIGHVRSKELQVQATNYYGRIGYEAVENAIASGVVDLSLVNKDGDNKPATVTWNTSVPVYNYPSIGMSESSSYNEIASFWNSADKLNYEPYGWVYVVANGGWSKLDDYATLGTSNYLGYYYKQTVVSELDILNKHYLNDYANYLNNLYSTDTFVPSYAVGKEYLVNIVIDGKVVDTIKTKENSIINYEVPKKEGYIFVCWFTEENGSYISLGTSTINIKNYDKDEINVYAGYLKDSYELKFYVDDKEVQSSTSDIYKETFKNLPDAPTKEGYNFVGWYLDDIYLGKDELDFRNAAYYLLVKNFDKLNIVAKFEAAIKSLDVYVNYTGKQGITYRGTAGEVFGNTIDGKTYVIGDLLPTWQAFEKELDITINEASAYSTNNDNNTFSLVLNNNFKSELYGNDYIDLFYNTVANINQMGLSGQAIDLTPYIENGSMPNFKKFLDSNPEIRYEITALNGEIYYTPYFDSYNDVEKGFVMDTSIVELLLNNKNATFDNQLINGVKGDSNVITDVKYQPFINPDYNYDKDTTVKVSVYGKAYDLTIKKTENIIKQQNELLSKGCTGSDLALQFIDYLNEAFGDNVGEGKIYNNLSEIFTSEAAAYNVDELVALMRVAKANPGLITGDIYNEVETLFPRGQAANRVQNILQFAQVWGVQGLTSEKDFLYFLQDGTLNDARTTQASYDALDNLAALYSEGLILNDFWYYSDAAKDGSAYYKKYFAKTTDDYGYGLLEFDYFATQCAGNDMVNGIGTSSRSSYYGKVNGIKPVLPPLTMWPTERNVTVSQGLNDFTGKTLIRHFEDNRTIKANAWCIPANSDNVENAIRLMDYLYSTMGSYIQDFGPSEYWENADQVLKDPENVVPVISNETYKMLSFTNMDFWSFMRGCIGATHGIGHVRSKEIQVQATNAYGRVGYEAVENAIASGVVDLSLVNKDGDNKPATVTWNTSVPVYNYNSVSKDVANTYEAVTSFWNSADKLNYEPYGWVYVVANGGWKALDEEAVLGTTNNTKISYTKADVIAQQDNMNKKYLFAYANSLNNLYGVITFIPDYTNK